MRAKRSVRVYLDDISTAIQQITRYTAKGEEHFLSETMVQDAVMRQLSIIGEAASKLPKTVQEEHMDIPWKKIIGMRNVLIHDYSETDLPTVWATIEKDLPELQHAIKAMLAENERPTVRRRKVA